MHIICSSFQNFHPPGWEETSALLLADNITQNMLTTILKVPIVHSNYSILNKVLNVCNTYHHFTYHRLSYKYPHSRALLSLWNQSAQLLSLDMALLSYKAEQNQQIRATTITIRLYKNRNVHIHNVLFGDLDKTKRKEWFSWHFPSSHFETHKPQLLYFGMGPLYDKVEQNQQMHHNSRFTKKCYTHNVRRSCRCVFRWVAISFVALCILVYPVSTVIHKMIFKKLHFEWMICCIGHNCATLPLYKVSIWFNR